MPAPAHIGIVACSAEGASLCYRSICAEGPAVLGPHAHPEVSLHSLSLADYVQCLDDQNLQGVAELMLQSAQKLAAAGADFLICPDNTVHQAFSWVEPASPLPWLHIADVVAAEAVARGHRRLGLTGTRWLVASEVYPEKLRARGLACVRPDDADRDEMGRLIMDELVRGVFRPQTVARFQQMIRKLQTAGCDAVILGCTEIPLIIDDGNSPLPTLDSTRLLARAALRRALAHTPAGDRAHPVAADPGPAIMPPFKVLRLDHVVLRVRNLDAMVRFYALALGCRVVRRRDELGLVHLRAGESMIDLISVDGPLGRKGGEAPGSHGRNQDHLCLRVDPLDEPAVRRHLGTLGVQPRGAASVNFGAEGDGLSLYFADPEGNVIELKGPSAAAG